VTEEVGRLNFQTRTNRKTIVPLPAETQSAPCSSPVSALDRPALYLIAGFTDADRCYGAAFKQMKIKEPHTMTKREPLLIESSNSRIRDPLACLNRKTKRFTTPTKCSGSRPISLSIALLG
jgi:hypothetical protein